MTEDVADNTLGAEEEVSKVGLEPEAGLDFIPIKEDEREDVEDLESGIIAGTEKKKSPQGKLGKIGSSAHDFLANRGFGWLVELEDDDEDGESISLIEELDIDVSEIFYKLRCVLIPFKFERKGLLESPDFWGPLLVVLFYAMILLWKQLSVVSWVLTMWLVGSLLIFALARVLGRDVTYSQTLGVIGYSLLPLTLIIFALYALDGGWTGAALKLGGTVWATYSASSILAVENSKNKQILLSYPVFLLYIYFLSLHSGI
eukprot:TRINITY_DN1853_c0_g1_i9.p2 TRINITY_DN1853_c0_g1~~TRINITY_DN1853_c0_g1_i9.p2  ORF type:complete len:259 (+),score=26.63 TRINITY_DN1853_c0_g1_i9:31-807(+)